MEGSCSVCGEASKTRCGNCKLKFYCGKEHQREDWQKHKVDCRAYEEHENKTLGRHLLATRDLAEGDLIISELPLVWGPSPHTPARVCVGCGCEGAICRCPECSWPACRLACDGLTDKTRHGFECFILSKANLVPKSEYLLILRMLILRRRFPKRWDILSKLQSHLESRGAGTEAEEETKAAAEYLGQLEPSAAEILPQICGLIDVNALETNPPIGSSAIYETACLLEHRCLGNTRHTFSTDEQGRPRIKVIAVRPIKKGEHLSTTYTHVMWSTRARREHLLATKYFSCRCERCADPTELGSHIGTLRCPCEEGFVLPKEPLDPESQWACTSCSGVLAADEAADLTDRLGDEAEEAMSKVDKNEMADLLSRLNLILHPSHQHCLRVEHSLIQLLPPEDPRKEELCKHIIETLDKVDPYGARLGLYLAIAYRELSFCPGQDKQTLQLKAVQLLRFEPPGSPGDILAKLIISEC